MVLNREGVKILAKFPYRADIELSGLRELICDKRDDQALRPKYLRRKLWLCYANSCSHNNDLELGVENIERKREMSIWSYQQSSRDDTNLIGVKMCPFCQTQMTVFHSDEDENRIGNDEVTWVTNWSFKVYLCSTCGWWNAKRHDNRYPISKQLMKGFYVTSGASAVLKDLDLTDISTPIEDVRSYLVARYEDRGLINPRLWEETVASVFKDLGYDVEVTAFSGDGGIDVILTRDSKEIGVQVKRYKERIEVAQIRELVGALVLRGITNGIFVTTSSFQSGADATIKGFQQHGYAIELIDAARFLDTLKVTRRPGYRSFEEFQELVSLNLRDLPEIGRQHLY